MAELSLWTVMEELKKKEGYTVTPGRSQLDDLKQLVNNMLAVRRAPLVGSGPTDNISGSVCPGHTSKRVYDSSNLSLDGFLRFNDSYIEPCSCDSDTNVACECEDNTDCGCVDRTSCECVAVPSCSCVNDICESNTEWCPSNYTCECVDRTSEPACDCNTLCECQSNLVYNDQGKWIRGCDCAIRTCPCQGRTIQDVCSGYEGDAWPVTQCPSNCGCESRDSTCDAKTVTPECPANISCTCDDRCSCNAVRTFE